jgi:hypothetical protein
MFQGIGKRLGPGEDDDQGSNQQEYIHGWIMPQWSVSTTTKNVRKMSFSADYVYTASIIWNDRGRSRVCKSCAVSSTGIFTM